VSAAESWLGALRVRIAETAGLRCSWPSRASFAACARRAERGVRARPQQTSWTESCPAFACNMGAERALRAASTDGAQPGSAQCGGAHPLRRDLPAVATPRPGTAPHVGPLLGGRRQHGAAGSATRRRSRRAGDRGRIPRARCCCSPADRVPQAPSSDPHGLDLPKRAISLACRPGSRSQLAAVQARAAILLDSGRCATLIRRQMPTQARDPARKLWSETS
jgi:hypothetical protein